MTAGTRAARLLPSLTRERDLILIENLIGILDDTPLTDLALADLAATVKSQAHLMGQISLFNLATAIAALRSGVPGLLTIEIPMRAGDRIEAHWQSKPAGSKPRE